ncbi:hypothetical protein QJS10_CPB18g01178 [Acorus calamus]|uniref:Uncharacterized protein n=1 Tax=Acorus calamus TaxID=4465 RepID=A0AAV9CRD1_ACOCL|nr:hypothetical protein QJS10_CPB18g01178 [Acorus calamus]
MVGILPSDKVTEVQRTDLVGEFVGHTGPKTRRKVCIHHFENYFFTLTLISVFRACLWLPWATREDPSL